MPLRLLAVIFCLLLFTGCAKPPVAELETVRWKVARAYAAGASRLAPNEYLAASQALQAAEQQVKEKRYSRAREALKLARLHAERSMRVAFEEKKEFHQEQVTKAEAEAEARAKEMAAARARAALEAERKRKLRAEADRIARAKLKPVIKDPPKPVLVDKIEVREGETLANISARKEVFDDSLLWPLIYKANRDQIKDPKQVFPGQTLVIPRDKTLQEKEAAREEARELNIFQ